MNERKTQWDDIRVNFIINDVAINKIISSRYNVFSKPYISNNKKCAKYNEQVYNGTKEDLGIETILILYQMFKDEKFNPTSSTEIYGELSKRLFDVLNADIAVSAYAFGETIKNQKGEIVDIYHIPQRAYVSSKTKPCYRKEFKEIMQRLHDKNIKDLTRPNAKAQRNIIDLIMNHYKEEYDDETMIYDFPSEKKMIDLYNEIYKDDGVISQPRYSAILSEIFELMCGMSTALDGIGKVTREQYYNQKWSERI